MELGIVSTLPVVFWIVFAASLVLPYRFPKIALVVTAVVMALGVVMMASKQPADSFGELITHELGTAVVVCASAWLVAAVAGLFRAVVTPCSTSPT